MSDHPTTCANCGRDTWRETADEDGRHRECSTCGAIWVQANRGTLDLGIKRAAIEGHNQIHLFFEEFTGLHLPPSEGEES